MIMEGRLILVVGPSGSGKGALMSYVRSKRPDIVFPVSCTTRAPRPGEAEGETYYFVTGEQFDQKVAEDAFVEWANYGGNRYGTLKSEILKPLEAGKTVIREIEVQGARHMQELIPKENLRIIFINAGAWEDLKRRIAERATIHPDELIKREERYEDERSFMQEATKVIENFDGGLDKAKAEFLKAVEECER